MTTRGKYVVAIDFGTTFSGFAFVQRRAGSSTAHNRVWVHYDWPERAARQYCKTPTALFYVSDEEDGPFELAHWGWPAKNAYANASRMGTAVYGSRQDVILLKLPTPPCNATTSDDMSHASAGGDISIALDTPPSLKRVKQYALFVQHFKLYFNADFNPNCPPLHREPLPGTLTPEHLVVDYLSQMSKFIMEYLCKTYDNDLHMDAVEWCLTVPGFSRDKAKQKMKECAEKAGLVQGKHCPQALQALASPFPIDIILEPEAASIYCQEDAGAKMDLRKEDNILVVDVGGGTIDLVVHTKINDDPANVKVKEAVESFGEYGGGTFVDKDFLVHLDTKIRCFEEVQRREPNAVLSLLEWWESRKKNFTGLQNSPQYLDIIQRISHVWQEHDIACGIYRDKDYYSEIILERKHFQKIFDPEVDKVLGLIERHLAKLKVVMVVGGFASSPYLTLRIRERLKERGYMGQIIVPQECESAICRGAVRLHLLSDSIQSRISQRTYGIRVHRPQQSGDPLDSLFTTEDGVLMCRGSFKVFVKKGERVPINEKYPYSLPMQKHDQKQVEVKLYSSAEDSVPKFVTDEGCVLEDTFVIDVEEGMELGKNRQMEITMVFGASSINMSAARKNFGDTSEIIRGPSNVAFNVEPVLGTHNSLT